VEGSPVYLGKSAWEIGYVQEKNPAIRFSASQERAA
jgi:peptide chain release factor 3